MRELRKRHRAERAEHDSGDPSRETQHQRLDKELEQNIEARRAQRLAHADLACAFRDRHEHDVHDADAADEQADCSDARQQVGERLRRVLERGENVRLVSDLEIVLAAGSDLMLAPHHALDLDHRERHLRHTGRVHGDRAQPVRTHDAVAAGLQRNQDLLVRIPESSRRALRRQDADDLEWNPANLNLLPDHRGRIPVEHVRNRRAEHRVAAAPLVFTRREHSAGRDRVVLDRRIVGCGADDAHIPVLPEVLDLQVAGQLGHDAFDVARIPRQRGRVIDRDAHALVEHDRDPAPKRLSGINRQQRRAECLQPRLHGLLGSAAERHHRDHRADADDDAQHRQERPQLVGADRLERDLDDFPEQHPRASWGSPAAAVWSSAAAAARRASRRPSPGACAVACRAAH